MSDKLKSTCAVTVTYGQRLHFLLQTLDGVLKAGVKEIVVVCNGTDKEIAVNVRKFSESRGIAITVVELASNSGSAGGFKRGLEEAHRLSSEYIWLLDDDNLAGSDSLSKLQIAHELLLSRPENILLSYRRDRTQYREAVEKGIVPRVKSNSFLDFHFLQSLKRKMAQGHGYELDADFASFPLIRTFLAPYGGLYFHKSWLDAIGYPDSHFFLYGDDHDFCDRMIRAGASIFLCSCSQIEDIEQSWNESAEKISPWLSKKSADDRIFYSIRNRVFFEKRFQTSSGSYFFNMGLYLFVLFVRSLVTQRDLRFTYARAHLVIDAVKAGLRARRAGGLEART